VPTPLKNVFLTESQIQSAVKQLSRSVLDWSKDSKTKTLNLVSILEGARPLTRDLTACLKKISPETQINLYEVSVKGTDGHQNLLADRQVEEGFLDLDVIRQHPTLIVDDLVDSGLTLKKLKDELSSHGVKGARTLVLIRKFGGVGGPVDFLGFDLNWNQEALAEKGFKDCWLYGYGMDLDGQQRDLKRIEGVYIPQAGK
jgi:hypoxanthine phosphoribosyltransferase